MRIDCVSIFPELIQNALASGVLGRAQQEGTLQLVNHQLREYTTDKHQKTDDVPYGGGAGMVFKPEPFFHWFAQQPFGNVHVIHPSPSGRLFTQTTAKRLASKPHLVFLLSRYEGLDQRVIDRFVDEELSIGDYVISGGELAAAVMIDAIVRLLPGVLGNPDSLDQESHAQPMLEYPHYTRPPHWEDLSVPEVLLSGNHQKIEEWRNTQALEKTKRNRPDLLGPRE
jgi:tRNA (guanine37-N1)-methyltransferase